MFRKKPIKADGVSIYIHNGKVFIPSRRAYPSFVIHSNPVFISNIKIEDMISAVDNARRSGWEELPEPESRENVRIEAEKVMLRATKTRSWKELAKSSPAYGIAWTEDYIRLSISQLDKQGRYEFPKSKQHIFPLDTALDNILEIILADAKQRKETSE